MKSKTASLHKAAPHTISYLQGLLISPGRPCQANCMDCRHQIASFALHGAPNLGCERRATPGSPRCRHEYGRRGCNDAHLYAAQQGGRQ